MIYVGIDWGTLHDDQVGLAPLGIIGAAGQIIKEFRVAVNAVGFQRLLEELLQFGLPMTEIVIGVETDKNIVVDFLIAKGFSVTAINPLSVNRFKERYSTAQQKDDKFDAFNIAQILKNDAHRFKAITRTSPACEKLRVHCRALEKMVARRTRLVNVLSAELGQYYPVFTGFFTDLSRNLTLNILVRIPAPSMAENLTEEKYCALLADVKHFPKTRKANFFTALQEHTIHFDNPKEQAFADSVRAVAQEILFMNSRIEKLEESIFETFDKHADAKIFSSIPGLGTRLAPRMLMHMGDNRNRFESHEQVQAYSGCAPVTQQSGRVLNKTKMRRGCNKNFRNTFYQLSFTSIRLCPWARTVYDELRLRGKSHSAALRAIGNKWAKIVYAMWQNHELYDVNRFEKKRLQCKAA